MNPATFQAPGNDFSQGLFIPYIVVIFLQLNISTSTYLHKREVQAKYVCINIRD